MTHDLHTDPNQLSTGFITYEDGTQYEGAIIDTVPHGKGMLKTANGHEYAGTFFYGKTISYGVWTNPEGETMHGQWNELEEFKPIEGGEWK